VDYSSSFGNQIVSEPCQKFVYSKEYFSKTIVTEVRAFVMCTMFIYVSAKKFKNSFILKLVFFIVARFLFVKSLSIIFHLICLK